MAGGVVVVELLRAVALLEGLDEAGGGLESYAVLWWDSWIVRGRDSRGWL